MICTMCKKREVSIKKRDLCLRCYQVEYRRNKEKFKKNDFTRWKFCKQCDQKFEVFTSKTHQRFCSRKCIGEWRSIHMIGFKGPASKPSFLKCEFCGQTKKLLSSQITNKKFCSPQCSKSFYNMVRKRNLVYFKVYNKRLSLIDEIRKSPRFPILLEVKCTYCGKWFSPSRMMVQNRIRAIEGKQSYGWGEARFYCSDGCKEQCPVFNQKLYPKGFKVSSSREAQPELRKMVFERDNWTCQKCGSIKNLHCHHITGVELNPIESADIDNCITFCKECHKEIHKQKGCTYFSLRKKAC